MALYVSFISALYSVPLFLGLSEAQILTLLGLPS